MRQRELAERMPSAPEKARPRVEPPSPVAPETGRILDLQRRAGNRATVASLDPQAQAKLIVGAADDQYEREADVVAQAVLSRLAGGPESPGPATVTPDEHGPIGRLTASRRVARRADGKEGGEVDPGTEAAIEQARRSGRKMDGDLRTSMEGAFGADFSAVKLHSGAESAALNRAVGAQAFTIGSDIFLGASTPDLSSRAGQGLLAHELAHTVQQGGAVAHGEPAVQRFPATTLSDPPMPAVDWKADTASVSKSGEGKSGGVFFLKTKSKTDAVQSIVIKPNYGANANGAAEYASQLVMGDRVVSSLFGIGAPSSRIVPKGSPEFTQILDLIKPKDTAPTDKEDLQFWHPVTDASAMIVMGAVPNAASLSSLAESAMDDTEADKRLYAAVFSKPFLFDLGKLMVADLLMGNDDRMVAGAMNVGNIMVSSSKEGGKLYAIDSRAVLPTFKPEQVVSDGSASLSGWSSTVEHLKKDPSYYLDGFFETLKKWYHGGVEKINAGQEKKAPEGTIDPAELLWMSYQATRARSLEAFTAGFQDGMSTVMALSDTKQGQDKMKGLTDQFAGQEGSSQVQSLALKTNAAYLSNRAKGKTHEDSAKDPAAAAALQQLGTTFNPADYRLPENDQFHWTRTRPPGSDAYTAALEGFQLPNPNDMGVGAGTLSKDTGNFNPQKLSELDAAISDIKDGIDSLGKKSRGTFSKKEQPRNRVVAGRFLADTYLVAAGGIRAAGYAKKLFELGKLIEFATSSKMDPAAAKAAMPAVQFLIAYRKDLQRQLDEYEDALKDLAKAVAKMKKFQQKDQVVSVLGLIAAYIPRCAERFLGANQVVNANLYLNLMKSSA